MAKTEKDVRSTNDLCLLNQRTSGLLFVNPNIPALDGWDMGIEAVKKFIELWRANIRTSN